MTSARILRGITWNHARGSAPMLATAARFHQAHPDLTIVWESHSLKTFEDSPVDHLAAEYDLLVLDHPCIVKAAPTGALLDLNAHLPSPFLADQARQAVGASHRSYTHRQGHWALAIDAAAPVAFWRGDLLARHDAIVPRTWEEVLALARRGHVEIPAAPINCLMNFYTLCLAAGAEPFATPDHVAPAEAGAFAIARLRELIELCDPGCWDRNPIASHDLTASAANQRIVYCPLAYGYSNYAREGFGAHVLTFGEPPLLNGAALRTTLGGAGLAISALRGPQRHALAYAQFVASEQIQRTLYTQSGGQPGHRAAWLDEATNHLTGNYFRRTLPALDRAYLRPQFGGYMHFQNHGALLLHAALRGKVEVASALAQLDTLYRESQLLSLAIK